jgi:hypothetical protein
LRPLEKKVSRKGKRDCDKENGNYWKMKRIAVIKSDPGNLPGDGATDGNNSKRPREGRQGSEDKWAHKPDKKDDWVHRPSEGNEKSWDKIVREMKNRNPTEGGLLGIETFNRKTKFPQCLTNLGIST